MTRTSKYIPLAAAGALVLAGFIVGRARTRRAERRSPPPGAFAGRPGARLHYLQMGQGPDLVLIHGAATSMDEMLAGPAEVLARRYRVTLFDRPGHGHSPADGKRAAVQDQAEKIHAAVRELGLQRPVIVGHSLGGGVALAYGAAWPHETSGVVAIAPTAYPGWGPMHIGPAMHAAPVLGRALSYTTMAITDPMLAPAMYRLIFAPQPIPERFNATFPFDLATRPAAMWQDGRDIMLTSANIGPLTEIYPNYPAPVHVIAGDKDKVLNPERHAKRLARALGTRGRLTLVPGLGHMVHHFATDPVLAAIEDVRTRSAGEAGSEQQPLPPFPRPEAAPRPHALH